MVTLHRPSNVDSSNSLTAYVQLLNEISKSHTIIFPAHPRTKSLIESCGLTPSNNFLIIDPLPYLEFLGPMAEAKCVITDSRGVQEETTVLKVPCITVRENTERPVSIDMGTSALAGN